MKFKYIFSCLLFATVSAHVIDYIRLPGLKLPSMSELNTKVLTIETFTDFLWSNLYVGAFYYALYLVVGGTLESTNPTPKTQYRQTMTKKQIALGLAALFYVITYTTFWMWKLEKLGPYYGYYEVNEFGIKEFLQNLAVYFFVFDWWFFSTHVAIHHPIFWHSIHRFHHQFVEPTAYGQDAVHPFEAILQGLYFFDEQQFVLGPMGHFFVGLIWPMHPVWHSFFGFLTGVYAIFAHDGRWDPAGHNNHHFYISCNFGVYGFWDKVCGTKYNKQNYPVEYIPTWIRETEKKYIE